MSNSYAQIDMLDSFDLSDRTIELDPGFPDFFKHVTGKRVEHFDESIDGFIINHEYAFSLYCTSRFTSPVPALLRYRTNPNNEFRKEWVWLAHVSGDIKKHLVDNHLLYYFCNG